MISSLRWLRLFANLCLFIVFLISALNYKTSVYLFYQVSGQVRLILNTQPIEKFVSEATLSEVEKNNLLLIEEVKNYSVDSLGYKPTKNFTSIYDQRGEPVLWVITACEPYALKPYEWKFPVVGRVSYKGFFKKNLATIAYNHMAALGYDVDLRSVSAWSTLGWLKDPVLTSMLKRSKGSLCNLLFHELFHATYYAPNSVDFNENIASFIAHKATLRFLKRDTLALNDYLQNYEDNKVYNAYMLRRIEYLKNYYDQIRDQPSKSSLKLRAILQIVDSIEKLPLKKSEKYSSRRKEILKFKNAYFVDFVQYDSMQDSLEEVFNKIYTGQIEKLVQHLKLE
ncbi:hypothetical protein CNR22_06720 [Sphingobacteriaceae bacterium]|nr:hypothetical protein CNR22_06720 [Sphingobacteriaceae bacterium]